MALIGDMQYLTIGNKTYRIASSQLPIASASTLGGIKVGTGLTIDNTTGVLSATGTSVTIDNALSDSSTNPVQNKVIKTALDNKANTTNIPTKTSDLTNDSNFMSGMTILSYGSSTWNDFLTAYQANHVVYCRASSNSNPASGSQTRMAFMAYVSNATNPTNVEFQYYRSVSSHSASQQGDQVYIYKLTNANAWTVTVREASVKVTTGSSDGIDVNYSSGAVTIGHTNSVTAQSTQAVYPIKIDKNGHISEYGNAVSIPTKVSDLTNDSGFITSYTETDPIFTASAAAGISSTDITNWNNKADEYTAGDGIDITSNVISVDSNLTVQGDTAYLQYTEPIDVTKQDVLVSGQNIKTINNQSILGSGNINTVTNLVDGSSTGSIRGIGTVEQGTGYTLGNYALAAGQGTVSQGRSQTAIGEYNTIDSSSNSNSRGQYAFVVGNGIDTNTRSNAFTVDWQGNTQVKKTLTVGSNSNITGGLQVGALENDYGLNDQALLEEETKQKWNTILGNGALANLLAGDVGGRIATSGAGSTISNMEWNLVDTVIGNSDSITIPEDVFTYNEQVEVLAQVILTQGTTDITICGSFLIPNNNDIWMMNGYVTSSTDWGLVDFNLSNHGRTIELNNCYYAATQHNTDATVNIYYRLEESLLTDDVIDAWTEILGGDPSLNPSAGNIAATGSEWLQVQDPQNLPTNITLGSNNLMYKTSSDRNTVILTGTLSVNLAAASITDTTIDIPLGFNVSRVPSTAVELPLGVDGNQSQATASIKVGTTGAVSLVIQVIDNNSIAAELNLGFSGSFFPLV